MISLRRTLQVEVYELDGIVSLGQRRPEFLAILELAASFLAKGRASLSPKDVADVLMGELPAHLAKRVLERCEHLGLLSKQSPEAYTLTEAGRESLDEGLVLTPQEGRWRLYVSADPLLHSPIFHLEAIERWSNPESPIVELGRGHVLSKLMHAKEVGRSCMDGGRYQVHEFGLNAFKCHSFELDLAFEWAPLEASPKLSLEGPFELLGPHGDSTEFNLKPKVSLELTRAGYQDLWCQLVAPSVGLDVATLKSVQTPERLVLPTSFERLSPEARRSFVTDWELNPTRTERWGTFEPTSLKQVNVIAKDRLAAQLWAEWLFEDRLDSYVTPSEIQRLQRELSAELGWSNINWPSPRRLAAKFRKARFEAAQTQQAFNPKWDFVLTPFDLGLWDVEGGSHA